MLSSPGACHSPCPPFHDGSFLLLWFTFKHPQLSPQQNVFNTRRMIRPILQPNRFSVSSIRLALTFNLPHPTSVAAGHSTVDWIRVRHQEFQGQVPGTSSLVPPPSPARHAGVGATASLHAPHVLPLGRLLLSLKPSFLPPNESVWRCLPRPPPCPC